MIGLDAVFLVLLVGKVLALFTNQDVASLLTQQGRFAAFTALAVALLIAYLLLRLLRGSPRVVPRILIVTILGIFLLGALLSAQIVSRRLSKPYLFIHDGAVQTEDAIAALRHGENPYTIDYSGRAFGAFPESFSLATRPNPAWTHYAYLPLQIILGVPAAAVSKKLVGWFDIRFLYVLSFLGLVLATIFLTDDREKKILVLILVIFNPLFIEYFLSGFNDVFFLAWIALSALALTRNRYVLAGVFFGAALASKQSAWLLLPFYVAHLFFSAKDQQRRVLETVQKLVPAAITAGAVLIPFILWSPGAFFDDTVRYLSSGGSGYPISGIGLSQLLLLSGVITTMWSNFPFWILQVVVGLPLLSLLIRWQRGTPTISIMIAAYGIFALAMWFLSRFFNDSYLGVLSMIFILSFAANQKEETT